MDDIVVWCPGPGEAAALGRVRDDVFDGPVRPDLAAAFLDCPRHHLALARVGDEVIGMAAGVEILMPDKPAQLFVNELGVAGSWRRRGIARRLLGALERSATAAGCRSAWVATETDNVAARGLYAARAGAPDLGVFYAWDLSGD